MTVEAPERTYTNFDKSLWGDGPWQDEPDKLQFTDEVTGLPCLIVRNVWEENGTQSGSGGLCGYVGVTEGHPFFGVEYTTDAVQPIAHRCSEPWCSPSPEHVLEVHGGITYSDFCQAGPESRTICHVPAPGEPDRVWWLGFDCAHYRDYCPIHDRMVGRMPNKNSIYRSVAYVRAECASLAAQLVVEAQPA